jgi:hypothetical protein
MRPHARRLADRNGSTGGSRPLIARTGGGSKAARAGPSHKAAAPIWRPAVAASRRAGGPRMVGTAEAALPRGTGEPSLHRSRVCPGGPWHACRSGRCRLRTGRCPRSRTQALRDRRSPTRVRSAEADHPLTEQPSSQSPRPCGRAARFRLDRPVARAYPGRSRGGPGHADPGAAERAWRTKANPRVLPVSRVGAVVRLGDEILPRVSGGSLQRAAPVDRAPRAACPTLRRAWGASGEQRRSFAARSRPPKRAKPGPRPRRRGT